MLAGIVHGPTVTVATDAGKRTVRHRADRRRRASIAPPSTWASPRSATTKPSGSTTASCGRLASTSATRISCCTSRELVSDDDLVAHGRRVNDLVPGGINVELVMPGPRPGELTMQVYERGVGLTEACGTGACAVAAAAEHWELDGIHRSACINRAAPPTSCSAPPSR